MPNKLIFYTYESWAEVDRATARLTARDATMRYNDGSSIAWTLGHITTMVDSWVNTKFQRLPPHPFISRPNFRTGGTGEEKDWPAVRAGVTEVREWARKFLDSEEDRNLDHAVPYDGSIPFLRSAGLSLNYALELVSEVSAPLSAAKWCDDRSNNT